MPEFLSKTRQTGCETPENQTDDQEHFPVAEVGEKPGENTGQRVEVVEHWTSKDLVDETFAAPPPSAGSGIVEVIPQCGVEDAHALVPVEKRELAILQARSSQ